MSGTGKSTALADLGRRGFRVVDTDSTVWSEWLPSGDGGGGEWLWRQDRMAELLAADDERTLYVSGCMSNQGKFYDQFDAVVLLSAPAEVILDRIAKRRTNDYGKAPANVIASFSTSFQWSRDSGHVAPMRSMRAGRPMTSLTRDRHR